MLSFWLLLVDTDLSNGTGIYLGKWTLQVNSWTPDFLLKVSVHTQISTWWQFSLFSAWAF